MSEASIMRLAIRLACASWLMIALGLAWISVCEGGTRDDTVSAIAVHRPARIDVPAAPARLDATPGQSVMKLGGNL